MEIMHFDKDAYLRRIGAEGCTDCTAQNLKRLTRAHLEAVPFENLTITEEKNIPSLEPGDLFDKIVVRERGGYCFELNKAFFLLLQSLGYSCISVAARVVHHFSEPRPISHRAIIAEADGERWFVDVGFGGAGPKGALRIDTDETQTVFGDTFRIIPEEDHYVLSRLSGESFERVLVFYDKPWLDVDFATLNNYYATFPRSPFRAKRILYRCTPQGWISLTDEVFTTCADGNSVAVTVAEDRIPELIREQFGLIIR